jgi:hypothetical protein
MPTYDLALVYDCIDPDEPTTKYQLQFRFEYRPGQDPRTSLDNPSGQLVAAVKNQPEHPANTVAISRLDVPLRDVEAAVDTEHWPFLAPKKVDLAQIRARIRAAGLD